MAFAGYAVHWGESGFAKGMSLKGLRDASKRYPKKRWFFRIASDPATGAVVGICRIHSNGVTIMGADAMIHPEIEAGILRSIERGRHWRLPCEKHEEGESDA